MRAWVLYAVAAAILYGLHQVFTKLAANRIGEGVGGVIVETSAAAVIALYLAALWIFGRWDQSWSLPGIGWSLTTGLCVGLGTIAFFLLFLHGAPLSVVPGILGVGSALMVVAGIVVFRESLSVSQGLGVVLSLAGFYLLSR